MSYLYFRNHWITALLIVRAFTLFTHCWSNVPLPYILSVVVGNLFPHTIRLSSCETEFCDVPHGAISEARLYSHDPWWRLQCSLRCWAGGRCDSGTTTWHLWHRTWNPNQGDSEWCAKVHLKGFEHFAEGPNPSTQESGLVSVCIAFFLYLSGETGRSAGRSSGVCRESLGISGNLPPNP